MGWSTSLPQTYRLRDWVLSQWNRSASNSPSTPRQQGLGLPPSVSYAGKARTPSSGISQRIYNGCMSCLQLTWNWGLYHLYLFLPLLRFPLPLAGGQFLRGQIPLKGATLHAAIKATSLEFSIILFAQQQSILEANRAKGGNYKKYLGSVLVTWVGVLLMFFGVTSNTIPESCSSPFPGFIRSSPSGFWFPMTSLNPLLHSSVPH